MHLPHCHAMPFLDHLLSVSALSQCGELSNCQYELHFIIKLNSTCWGCLPHQRFTVVDSVLEINIFHYIGAIILTATGKKIIVNSCAKWWTFGRFTFSAFATCGKGEIICNILTTEGNRMHLSHCLREWTVSSELIHRRKKMKHLNPNSLTVIFFP